MFERSSPTQYNGFRQEQALLLHHTFYRMTGKRLIDCPQAEVGKRLFFAPFALVSHDTRDDPVFNYANQVALDLFHMSWEQFTALPSRESAEQPLRQERERLLTEVTKKGYISNYTGVRISATGERFFIENAVVWNLNEQGVCLGQAAMFRQWRLVVHE